MSSNAITPIKDRVESIKSFIVFSYEVSIEVFINEGEKVMTSRIYPVENAKGICFFADQEIELITLSKWNLSKGVSPLMFKG
ncbi:GH32 C-terminal domain-containing protein [Priestia sp. FSL R5-0597]|uniref:GH32 C-terminal domain-containing protein n=1 Tax=Priestia sp. FSL R5-0597 TaxID=2921580 RepID=UPI0030F98C72